MGKRETVWKVRNVEVWNLILPATLLMIGKQTETETETKTEAALATMSLTGRRDVAHREDVWELVWKECVESCLVWETSVWELVWACEEVLLLGRRSCPTLPGGVADHVREVGLLQLRKRRSEA